MRYNSDCPQIVPPGIANTGHARSPPRFFQDPVDAYLASFFLCVISLMLSIADFNSRFSFSARHSVLSGHPTWSGALAGRLPAFPHRFSRFSTPPGTFQPPPFPEERPPAAPSVPGSPSGPFPPPCISVLAASIDATRSLSRFSIRATSSPSVCNSCLISTFPSPLVPQIRYPPSSPAARLNEMTAMTTL